MKPGPSRGMPTRVKLALLGAVLALGALGLPWMGSRLEAIPHLMGYEDSMLWVGLRVVAALATVVLALQLVKVPDLRETQRAVFGASAVLFLLRPITLIITNPSTSELSTAGVRVEQVFSPSWGILVSFVAAAVMGAAAVLTHRSDDVREAAEREAARAALLQDPDLAAFAGPPPAPLVTPTVVVADADADAVPIDQPVSPTHVSPQPAPLQEIAPAAPSQQHPRAPMHDHSPYRPAASAPLENAHLAMPVVMDDTGPYGPDGPSRLGDSVRVEDTLAPKAAAPAPHLALMQQPAPLQAPPQATAHDQAPVPTAPPSLAPLPPAPAQAAPSAPPSAAAEPRQRSVAPPGFG